MADGGTDNGWPWCRHPPFFRHRRRIGDRSKNRTQNHAAALPFAAWFSSSICKSIIAFRGDETGSERVEQFVNDEQTSEVRSTRFLIRHAGLVPVFELWLSPESQDCVRGGTISLEHMFPQGVQALCLRLDGPRNKSGVTLNNGANFRLGTLESLWSVLVCG